MTLASMGRESFLEGVLVVEWGDRISVGACGGLLAQLGARVVVIEPSQTPARGKWVHRAVMMAGKESLIIDPDSAADQDLLAALIERAQVLLTSSDIGPAKRTWQSPRPSSQIVCDVTAFGHDGPLAGRGASEAIVQALGGIADTTGAREGPPAVVGAPVLEMSTAVFAATSVLAALRVRRLHGFGQRIDMALLDTALNELVNFLPLHYAGQVATRSGNRHPLHVPWGSYPAQDGHVLVCSVTAEHFGKICEAIGQPEMAKDERFCNSAARLKNFVELDRLIGQWTLGRTVAECESILGSRGVACGPIISVQGLEFEKNLQHRASLIKLVDPLTGNAIPVPASPLRGTGVTGLAPEAIPDKDSFRHQACGLLAQAADLSGPSRISGDAVSSVRALQGLRVIEIGQYTVAPLVSRHLGALGADVIKIESPAGDAVRYAAPLRQDGLAQIFALSNTDKRGLVLDLRDAAHQEMLHRLLEQSDVLVENLRPGALAKLGFSSEKIQARHPKLIYCSVNGFGNESAYPGRSALDTVIQAMSGLMSLTMVNGEPTKAGISASDMLGGEFGLLAVMAALEYRDRTGRACHFDISMQDASSWMTQMHWAGSGDAEASCVLAASDGFVVAQAHQQDAQKVTGAALWSGNRDSLVQILLQAGIDAAPVLSVGEVVASPQVGARGLLIERPTTDGDAWTVLGSPLRLLSTPAQVRSAMARLGSEDQEIIRQFHLDAHLQQPPPSSPHPTKEDHELPGH